MKSLRITKPDDWHLHLRDGNILKAVLPESIRHFGRALIMPNLSPPILTVAQAIAYRERIIKLVPKDSDFNPLMTLYLTEETQISDIQNGFDKGLITAIKLYPAGATTNSTFGIKNFSKLKPILEHLEEIGLPLCVHGEVADEEIDIFDREAVFIDKILEPIRRDLPNLRIVLEHITTKNAVDFVRNGGSNLAATITTHHLVINRNAILSGGIKPHYYCLPIAKREYHRQALRKAATSGKTCFFLGTDSAPHTDHLKENTCGCAGCFTAPNTISILATVFEQELALHKLEAFISTNGAKFYNLKPNNEYIILEKGAPMKKIEKIFSMDGKITVFDPGYDLHWKVK
jgi:dihydroorotase